jgi:hypothetical protein
MTKPSLSALYRQHQAENIAWDGERLAALLGGSGRTRESRDEELSAMAESPLKAQLLRVAMALESDAETLSSAVRQARSVRVSRHVRPAWMAMAASLFAVAVLMAMRAGTEAPQSAVVDSSATQSISNLSFEGAATVVAQENDDAPIFVADFDT